MLIQSSTVDRRKRAITECFTNPMKILPAGRFYFLLAESLLVCLLGTVMSTHEDLEPQTAMEMRMAEYTPPIISLFNSIKSAACLYQPENPDKNLPMIKSLAADLLRITDFTGFQTLPDYEIPSHMFVHILEIINPNIKLTRLVNTDYSPGTVYAFHHTTKDIPIITDTHDAEVLFFFVFALDARVLTVNSHGFDIQLTENMRMLLSACKIHHIGVPLSCIPVLNRLYLGRSSDERIIQSQLWPGITSITVSGGREDGHHKWSEITQFFGEEDSDCSIQRYLGLTSPTLSLSLDAEGFGSEWPWFFPKNLSALRISCAPFGPAENFCSAFGSLTGLEITAESPYEADITTALKTIGFMANLVALTIRRSSLVELPMGIYRFRSLKQLALCNNKRLHWLSYMLKSLTNLESLHIENSAMRRLPAQLGRLHNLQTLCLKDNKRLGSLPETIGGCTNLLDLQIINCPLKSIPAKIAKLRKLQRIFLKDLKFLRHLPLAIRHLGNILSIEIMGDFIRQEDWAGAPCRGILPG